MSTVGKRIRNERSKKMYRNRAKLIAAGTKGMNDIKAAKRREVKRNLEVKMSPVEIVDEEQKEPPTKEKLDAAIVNAFENNIMKTVSTAIFELLSTLAKRHMEDEPENEKGVLKQWMHSMERALKDLALYISTLQIDKGEGENGLLTVYLKDRQRVLQAALEAVFSLSSHCCSSARNAVSRFGVAKGLDLPVDLNNILEQEISRNTPGPASERVRNLSMFRKEVAIIFCGPIISGFKSLALYPRELTEYALIESVRFVEVTKDFYRIHDDFPGDDFRSLLLSINVHIISAVSSNPDLDHLKPTNLDYRKLKSLQRCTFEPTGFMPESYSKPKMAEDVLLTRGSLLGELVLKAPDLLGVLRYLAAIQSLERKGIFCSGFFSTIGVLLVQCVNGKAPVVSQVEDTEGALGRLLAGAIRRATVVNGQETMSDSESDEDDNEINDGASMAQLIAASGGFFGDTSVFGDELRQLILEGHTSDVLTFAQHALEQDKASPTVRQLVLNLLDLVERMREREQEACQKQVMWQNGNVSGWNWNEEALLAIKGLTDPQFDKHKLVRVYVEMYPQYVTEHLVQTLHPDAFQPIEDTSTAELLVELFTGTNGVDLYVRKLFDLVAKNIMGLKNHISRKDGHDSSSEKDAIGILGVFTATLSPFGRNSLFGRIAALNKVDIKESNTQQKLLAPEMQKCNTAEMFEWISAVDMEDPHHAQLLKKIRDNSLMLQTKDQRGEYTALKVLMTNANGSVEIDNVLAKLVTLTSALLSIVDSCTALTPLPATIECLALKPNDVVTSKPLYLLSIDTVTIDNTVEYIVKQLQYITAVMMGLDENLQPDKLVAANRKEIPLGLLSTPSSVSTAFVSVFSRKYLSIVDGKKVCTNMDRKAEDMLIAAVAKRGHDLVTGQVLLAAVAAISLTIDLKKTDKAEMDKKQKVKRALLNKTAFMCVFTVLVSALYMTRLSNPHFFSVLESLNNGTEPITPTGFKANRPTKEQNINHPVEGTIANNTTMRNTVLGRASYFSDVNEIDDPVKDTMSKLDILCNNFS